MKKRDTLEKSPYTKFDNCSMTAVTDHRYVEGMSMLHSSYQARCWAVVAVHPQGKKEDVWVEEVVNAFAVKEI